MKKEGNIYLLKLFYLFSFFEMPEVKLTKIKLFFFILLLKQKYTTAESSHRQNLFGG